PEIQILRLVSNGIFSETPVNEFGLITVDDGSRHIRFSQSSKCKSNFARRLHLAQQESVDVCFRCASLRGFGGQSVTNCTGGSNDTAREHATIGAPVLRVENSIHIVVR